MTANKHSHILRGLMAAALILVTAAVILLNSLYSGVNYIPVLEQSTMLSGDSGVSPSVMVKEPSDAYHTIKIHILGNCITGSMLGSDGYGTFNALAAEKDPSYFLQNAAELFGEDDWTVGLLGSVLSDDDTLIPAEDSYMPQRYKGAASHAEILASGGVDILSLATLHTHDYGVQGYADTKTAVEAAGLSWGDDENAVYLEKEGVRIGIYLCSAGSAYEEDSAARIVGWVQTAAEKCDMIIVYVSDRGVEIESEWWTPLGKACIDAGASVVLCNREIGPLSIENYKDGVIIDSLGYFLNGGDRYGAKENFVYAVTVYPENGEITGWDGEMLPFYNYEEAWQPVMAE